MREPGDQLNEALERLDILQVAAALGIQLKLGAQRSPFRDDKRPSFSVFNKGKNAKDQVTLDDLNHSIKTLRNNL